MDTAFYLRISKISKDKGPICSTESIPQGYSTPILIKLPYHKRRLSMHWQKHSYSKLINLMTFNISVLDQQKYFMVRIPSKFQTSIFLFDYLCLHHLCLCETLQHNQPVFPFSGFPAAGICWNKIYLQKWMPQLYLDHTATFLNILACLTKAQLKPLGKPLLRYLEI